MFLGALTLPNNFAHYYMYTVILFRQCAATAFSWMLFVFYMRNKEAHFYPKTPSKNWCLQCRCRTIFSDLLVGWWIKVIVADYYCSFVSRARAIKEGLLPPRDDNISGRISDLIPATKALLTNLTFIANTLALCATALIATGLGPFISKFIQSQFGESSSTAGMYCVTFLDVICVTLQSC